MPFVGSKQLWRTATKLVVQGSLVVPGNPSFTQPVVDVVAESYPDEAEASGHAFYLIDAFTKDPNTFVFTDSFGITPALIYESALYVSHYKLFSAGPPALWNVYLRFTNLTAIDVNVTYKMYRWVGLD